MVFSYDPLEKDIPTHGYSSEFVSKAMARLVKPIDPNDPEQYPADLTVICGSVHVEAHSHVLCPDSSYFEVICKGGFLEGQTRMLKLPAEEEFLIRRLLCYRYTTGYNDKPYDDERQPPPQTTAPAYVSRLYLNAQMYSTADKYDIPSLKDEAAKKFDAVIHEMFFNACAKLVDDMIATIPYIYSSTPDGDRRLRDQAIEFAIYGWRFIQCHPSLRDLISAVPDFFKERRRKVFDTFKSDRRILRMFTLGDGQGTISTEV